MSGFGAADRLPFLIWKFRNLNVFSYMLTISPVYIIIAFFSGKIQFDFIGSIFLPSIWTDLYATKVILHILVISSKNFWKNRKGFLDFPISPCYTEIILIE